MKTPDNSIYKIQNKRLTPATFKKAVISSINLISNTVDVYIVGNTQTILQNIPLASSIDASQILQGDRCRVDCFSESNPSDMVVSYIYGRSFRKSTSCNGRSCGTVNTTIASSSPVKLQPRNSFANALTWDSSNYRFVVTQAGQYQINAFVCWSGAVSSVATFIYKNGVSASYNLSVAGSNLSAGLTDILDLKVGDYIELWVEQFTGTSKLIYDIANLTYLSMAKV